MKETLITPSNRCQQTIDNSERSLITDIHDIYFHSGFDIQNTFNKTVERLNQYFKQQEAIRTTYFTVKQHSTNSEGKREKRNDNATNATRKSNGTLL